MNERTEMIGNRTLCEIQADVCGVFTNPERIRILLLLDKGELSVGEIAQKLSISMPNLSQHLRLMKDRRCVVSRKDGKFVYYKVASPRFLEGILLIREGLREAESARA